MVSDTFFQGNISLVKHSSFSVWMSSLGEELRKIARKVALHLYSDRWPNQDWGRRKFYCAATAVTLSPLFFLFSNFALISIAISLQRSQILERPHGNPVTWHPIWSLRRYRLSDQSQTQLCHMETRSRTTPIWHPVCSLSRYRLSDQKRTWRSSTYIQ